jgi:catechol 2,3-dioxygenase
MAISDRISIDPDTMIGAVALTVSDLERARAFYADALGLAATALDDGSIALGAPGERPLILLQGDLSAPPLDRHATGLFHLAVLVPSRQDLAFALARLAEARWPLDGASDHLVSEALYLSDPDGNGIEIYRDRPRADWRRSNGQLEMATLPLDLRGLLAELPADGPMQRSAPPGTRIGHVHLQVADLHEAESFYSGVLGFDVTVRGYPGALFVSAGGYHHHIGLNTWHSRGASPAVPGSIGLRAFDVELPNRDALDRVMSSVRDAGLSLELVDGSAGIRDPSGNLVVLRARQS